MTSKRPVIIGAAILFISLLTIFAFWLIEYLAVFKDNGLSSNDAQILDQDGFNQQQQAAPAIDYKLETFAQNLNVPWSLVFTSSERLLISERGGAVRVVANGELLAKPVFSVNEVAASGEAGLMGMVADPNYNSNHYLYLAYTYLEAGSLRLKVVRYQDQGLSFANPKIIIANIHTDSTHAGGRLAFGPDGKLYLTTGDAADKQLAQIKGSLAGKILRINSDGSIPADNPFPDSAVYSLGHRNPQGLAWSIDGQVMYATEHGPSLFDGPAGGDEVNIISKGANYGWPLVSHQDSKRGLVDPVLLFTPAVAPASAMIYSGKAFPQFQRNLFFGALRGEGLVRVIFAENQTKVVAYEKLAGIEVGRVRAVTQGPDGYIYFTTSNQDGRGSARAGDDKIYRLVPKQQLVCWYRGLASS